MQVTTTKFLWLIPIIVVMTLLLPALRPARAQTPGEPPAKPLLAWTIAGDGAVYVLDAANTVYELDPTTLSPLASSSPLFARPADENSSHTLLVDKMYGLVHSVVVSANENHTLLATETYLLVSNQALSQTFILNRADLRPVETLAWAGPMALDPGKTLFMIAHDERFYQTDPAISTLFKRPGVLAFDLANLQQPPRVVIEPSPGRDDPYIADLWADPQGRQLYISFVCIAGCGSSGHGPYGGQSAYSLDTFEYLGNFRVSEGDSLLVGTSIAEKAGLIVATTHPRTGATGDRLVIFNRQREELKSIPLIHATSALIDPTTEWLYLYREESGWERAKTDLWVLHLQGDRLELQSVIPLSHRYTGMAFSPDQTKLYLAGPDNLAVFDTTILQTSGFATAGPLPEGWFVEEALTPPVLVTSPDIKQDGTAFVMFDYGELYRTTDHGQSWLYLPWTIYPDFKYLTSLSLSPDFATDQTLMSRVVYRSTNRGETWEKWSPPIAFVSDRDGNRELYTMNQAGAGLRRLTFNPAADENPAWSPAWTRLAFQSNRNGNWDIFSMRLDCDPAQPDAAARCDLRQLTDSPADEMLPAWSPDGRSIAYVSTQDGNPEIYVMAKDGQTQRRLTFNPGGDWRPAWLPDNQHLLFTTDRAGNNNIYQLTVPAPLSPTLTAELQLTPVITGPANDRDPAVTDYYWRTEYWFYFISDRNGMPQVYEAHSSGHMRKIPVDIPLDHPAIIGSNDIELLVSVQQNERTNIYALTYSATDRLVPLTNTPGFNGHPAYGLPYQVGRPLFSQDQLAALLAAE